MGSSTINVSAFTNSDSSMAHYNYHSSNGLDQNSDSPLKMTQLYTPMTTPAKQKPVMANNGFLTPKPARKLNLAPEFNCKSVNSTPSTARKHFGNGFSTTIMSSRLQNVAPTVTHNSGNSTGSQESKVQNSNIQTNPSETIVNGKVDGGRSKNCQNDVENLFCF